MCKWAQASRVNNFENYQRTVSSCFLKRGKWVNTQMEAHNNPLNDHMPCQIITKLDRN